MRTFAVIAAFAALVAGGCGSKGGDTGRGQPKASLEALWQEAAHRVALTPGTSDYTPGKLRISFLVIDRNGRPISRPRASFWLARGRDQRPFLKTTARIEPIGIPGESEHAVGHVDRLYVAHVRVSSPGTYWTLARPEGADVGALGMVVVRSRSRVPDVGDRAVPSRTPTLATADRRLSVLTTRVPPDVALLRYSIAGSLAARKPFVVTFATPRFCESRTCGPVVDVVDAVRRRFERRGVRFIHVEIYERNNPAYGQNRWVKQWRLPSEPWTFLVGRDGRIKARFEGSMSARELAAAVRRTLLPRQG